MRHYHVGENTVGCLPESDPLVVGTLEQARRAMQELADEYRDDGEYQVEGGTDSGYRVWRAGDRAYQLPTMIWADACNEDRAECVGEDGGE